uniref:Zinc-ribbon domain-containing protein n=1 Tax=Chromera velia CCMP2878 TaxID=1169474 RepID=A0A0G4IAR8_9ALVE|eukprot:Cvel_12643.t1-p1 / transcript=Cvel_12643.t1 / gene=Cvel_12643 / organism=Chromera_velia_CCMP2878 / gene_product=hypothetical protein / transcript_product=hypothetical protein / location=Cvel_scaffold835:25200-27033(+) / protein_length=468 / sequence_SO=supercontig / SO=protein_coding / is_pseudo=false
MLVFDFLTDAFVGGTLLGIGDRLDRAEGKGEETGKFIAFGFTVSCLAQLDLANLWLLRRDVRAPLCEMVGGLPPSRTSLVRLVAFVLSLNELLILALTAFSFSQFRGWALGMSITTTVLGVLWKLLQFLLSACKRNKEETGGSRQGAIETVSTCSACGSVLSKGHWFCPNCGSATVADRVQNSTEDSLSITPSVSASASAFSYAAQKHCFLRAQERQSQTSRISLSTAASQSQTPQLNQSTSSSGVKPPTALSAPPHAFNPPSSSSSVQHHMMQGSHRHPQSFHCQAAGKLRVESSSFPESTCLHRSKGNFPLTMPRELEELVSPEVWRETVVPINRTPAWYWLVPVSYCFPFLLFADRTSSTLDVFLMLFFIWIPVSICVMQCCLGPMTRRRVCAHVSRMNSQYWHGTLEHERSRCLRQGAALVIDVQRIRSFGGPHRVPPQQVPMALPGMHCPQGQVFVISTPQMM